MKFMTSLIITGWLLLLASCGGENTDNTYTNEGATLVSPAPGIPKSLQLNAQADSVAFQKVKTTAIKRPDFRTFTQGGKIIKKIKTHFNKNNSWLVLYETNDDLPQLQVILLSPDESNTYKKILVDQFSYDGATPQVKEVFFSNVDNDPEKELIILCTWEVKHQGLGIDATDYKVSIYDNPLRSDLEKLQPMTALMDKFGTGTEGTMEGRVESYPWKDKATILEGIKAFTQSEKKK